MTSTMQSGFLKVGAEIENGIDELPEAPSLEGTVAANGDIHVPKSAFNFGTLEFEVDTDVPIIGNVSGVIGIEINPTHDVTGNIDPVTGATELTIRLSIRAYRISGSSVLDVGNNCRIGTDANPIVLNMNTWTAPVATSTPDLSFGGIPYDPSTGLVRLADSTFAAPGQSGCSGLAAGQINGLIGLPSPAGSNAAEFELLLDPKPISFAKVDIATKPAALTNQTAANFTFNSSVPSGMNYECQLDGGSWTACSPSGVSYSDLADGPHTFKVRAIAGGSDATDPASDNSWSWTIDTVQPTLNVTGAPVGLTANRNATLNLSSTKPLASTTCLLDGNPYSPCEPGTPVNLTNLSDGNHTFVFEGEDAVGNPGSVSRQWTVDATKPVVTLTSVPPVVSPTVDWDFEFTATDNHELRPANPTQCRVTQINDPDPESTETPDPSLPQVVQNWANCTSPDTQVRENGFWLYEVRAFDRANNVSDIAAYTWKIDSNQPIINFFEGPGGEVSENTGGTAEGDAMFQFSSDNAGATFECSLNGAPATPCTNPVMYDEADLNPPGVPNTLTIKPYSDAVPPVEGVDTPYTWTIDREAPTLELEVAPEEYSGNSVAIFQFAADGTGTNATVECNLDNGGWNECDSAGDHEVGLPDGTHQMKLRAIDQAGNTSPVITHDWVIDTQAPLGLITERPAAFHDSGTARFSFNISDNRPGVKADCRIDGGTYAPCNTNHSHVFNGVADGSHTVNVRIADRAGNQIVRSHTWITDTVDPDLNITAGPASPTRIQTASIQFNQADATSGIATTECRVNGGAWSLCAADSDGWKHYTGPFNHGQHRIDVRVTDRSGNVTQRSHGWMVDRSSPQVAIATQLIDSKQTAESIEFRSDRPGASFECQLDGSSWTACTSPVTYSDLAQGNHVFQVRATADVAGETVTGTEASAAWRVLGEDPDPEVCPDGTTGTPPNCVEEEPEEECEPGQTGTPPNCRDDDLLPSIPPNKVVTSYDPETGRLAVRIRCVARFKPKCNRIRVQAVGNRGKKARKMSKPVVVRNLRSNRWRLTTLTIRPAFRQRVENMGKVNRKMLTVRLDVTARVRKKRKVRRVKQRLHHVYKVRVQG